MLDIQKNKIAARITPLKFVVSSSDDIVILMKPLSLDIPPTKTNQTQYPCQRHLYRKYSGKGQYDLCLTVAPQTTLFFIH